MIAGYRTTDTPPMWRCDAHAIWTTTDCPACDAELIALTIDSAVSRGGRDGGLEEGAGGPHAAAPSSPPRLTLATSATSCCGGLGCQFCVRTPESQR